MHSIKTKFLRQYSFFSFLNATQLRKIARIAVVQPYQRGEILLRENDPANAFYILLQGSVELFFTIEVEFHPELRKELKFRVIYPGEMFGISAFIEPHISTSTARAIEPSQVVKIETQALLNLCKNEDEIAYALIYQVAKAAIDRLNATRLQLAAAWTPTALNLQEE